MKIIFLDIDGVLNSSEFAREAGWGGYFSEDKQPLLYEDVLWIPEAVELLEDIVRATEAQIVIHSTWAVHFTIPKFKEMFDLYSWENVPILGKTDTSLGRSERIEKYIKDHNITEYVILDDLNRKYFSKDLLPKLVSTDIEIGITKEDAVKAINILNNN